MENPKMFQVSTLQALALGYSKSIITVGELLSHGNIGLGTFEDVDGEMIMLDGHCYQAKSNGSVSEAPADKGVPFCAVSFLHGKNPFDVENIDGVNSLKTLLDLKIEEDFGLNSMHIVRVDGRFKKVMARSESPHKSQHVELKEILEKTQKDFYFDNISGTLVCVYFPDYMDGINAPGWHFHFVSEDKTFGGHVFDLNLERGSVVIQKINTIEIQIPREAAFDTYSLREASNKDIKAVEQGNG